MEIDLYFRKLRFISLKIIKKKVLYISYKSIASSLPFINANDGAVWVNLHSTQLICWTIFYSSKEHVPGKATNKGGANRLVPNVFARI